MPTKKLFEIGGQWVARVEGRTSLYRFWYDARAGEIRRRSLETADIEEAKRLVAEHVLNTATLPAEEPENALLLAVLNHYFTLHSDNQSSAHVARRAGTLLLHFLETECGFGAEVKVGEFTKGLQSRFVIGRLPNSVIHRHTSPVFWPSSQQLANLQPSPQFMKLLKDALWKRDF